MTPLQLARTECANHMPDGSCLGVLFADTGAIASCTPTPRCVIAEPRACRYFEECIVPMAKHGSDARRVAEMQEAALAYWRNVRLATEATGKRPN